MGEGSGEVKGEGTMFGGKPVLVTEMYSPSEERREGSVHRGLSHSMEEPATRRQFVAPLLAGQDKRA